MSVCAEKIRLRSFEVDWYLSYGMCAVYEGQNGILFDECDDPFPVKTSWSVKYSHKYIFTSVGKLTMVSLLREHLKSRLSHIT